MSAHGMATQVLASEIVQALLADEKDGGYDLTAGMFGAAFSTLVRRWAAAELELERLRAQAPAAEPLKEAPTAWAVRSVSADFLGLYRTEGHARRMMADRSKPDDAELVPLHERTQVVRTADSKGP